MVESEKKKDEIKWVNLRPEKAEEAMDIFDTHFDKMRE